MCGNWRTSQVALRAALMGGPFLCRCIGAPPRSVVVGGRPESAALAPGSSRLARDGTRPRPATASTPPSAKSTLRTYSGGTSRLADRMQSHLAAAGALGDLGSVGSGGGDADDEWTEASEGDALLSALPFAFGLQVGTRPCKSLTPRALSSPLYAMACTRSWYQMPYVIPMLRRQCAPSHVGGNTHCGGHMCPLLPIAPPPPPCTGPSVCTRPA